MLRGITCPPRDAFQLQHKGESKENGSQFRTFEFLRNKAYVTVILPEIVDIEVVEVNVLLNITFNH